MSKVHNSKNILNIVVIVAALGYFVDIYDLILFSIVRVPSLKAIGIADAEIKNAGIYLINMQMMGMLIGGIVWGILGDKRGRLAALFLTGVKSITHIFTGQDVFSFVERWGGWISLATFAIIAHVLIRIPVEQSSRTKK